MFTRAGFNVRAFRRGRCLLWARITPAEGYAYHHWRWAQLWLFTTGDVAWVTRTFVAWPHTCAISNLIKGWYVPAYLAAYASPLRGRS